jgi:hypothetical protein
MEGSRLASIVLPDPGGPTSSVFATVCAVTVEIRNDRTFVMAA